MKHLLRHPLVNIIGISLFTAYYATVFFITAQAPGFAGKLDYNETGTDAVSFLHWWSNVLSSGQHIWFAWLMIAFTAVILMILITRRHPYDEYHTSMLMNSLVIATVLTLLAIAIFFVLVLLNPQGIIEKFMLFIVIHWVTVVLANLVYLFICKAE